MGVKGGRAWRQGQGMLGSAHKKSLKHLFISPACPSIAIISCIKLKHLSGWNYSLQIRKSSAKYSYLTISSTFSKFRIDQFYLWKSGPQWTFSPGVSQANTKMIHDGLWRCYTSSLHLYITLFSVHGEHGHMVLLLVMLRHTQYFESSNHWQYPVSECVASFPLHVTHFLGL